MPESSAKPKPKPKCFVIMPVTTTKDWADKHSDPEHFRHVFDHLFKPAIEAADYEAVFPIAEGSDLIHVTIIKSIQTEDLVLCDLSSLNPNVFFELGIRTAVNKPIAIVRDSAHDKIPFDLGVANCYTYNPKLDPWITDKEIPELTKHIKSCIERCKGKNPMWSHYGMKIEADAARDANQLTEIDKNDLIMERIDSLDRKIDLIQLDPDRLREEDTARERRHLSPEKYRQLLNFENLTNRLEEEFPTLTIKMSGDPDKLFLIEKEVRQLPLSEQRRLVQMVAHVMGIVREVRTKNGQIEYSFKF